MPEIANEITLRTKSRRREKMSRGCDRLAQDKALKRGDGRRIAGNLRRNALGTMFGTAFANLMAK